MVITLLIIISWQLFILFLSLSHIPCSSVDSIFVGLFLQQSIGTRYKPRYGHLARWILNFN